jgi:hypothetical protein
MPEAAGNSFMEADSGVGGLRRARSHIFNLKRGEIEIGIQV